MQMSVISSRDRLRSRAFLFTIPAVVVLLDRLSKWEIVNNLGLYHSVVVVPGFFNLTRTENSGAAFDILRDSTAAWKHPALISISLLAMVIVVVMLWKNSYALKRTSIGLALIFGGAMGNLWDRIVSHRVVDFLDFFLWDYHWPVFNIADSSIVIGVLLLSSEIFFADSKQNTGPVSG